MKHLVAAWAILVLAPVLAYQSFAGDPVHVKGYTRKDGTAVAPYTRSAPTKSKSAKYGSGSPSQPADPVPTATPTSPSKESTPAAAEAQAKARNDAASIGVDARVVEFLRQRVAGGSADAAYDLAVRHQRGEGVEKDDGEARRLMILSAQRGNEDAAKWIKANPPAADPDKK